MGSCPQWRPQVREAGQGESREEQRSQMGDGGVTPVLTEDRSAGF